MTHEHAWRRLPDLLLDRDEPELLAHVAACHDCQRQLFLLGRVDRLLHEVAPTRRRERRRGSRRRGHWLRFPAGLVAVATIAMTVLLLPGTAASRHFTLRTASGQTIGRAELKQADAGSMSLSLVARGLPGRRGAVYLLWAGADGARATTVGRFMVDPNGSCRAHFNLPGRTWAHFWVTPQGNPSSVVAST